MKTGLAFVIINPRDPLAKFVFPIHATLVFAKLEVLIPRQDWGMIVSSRGHAKVPINLKL